MDLLMIFIALIFIAISKKLFNSWFYPFGVFGFVWVLSLILFYIPVFDYQPLSKYASTLIWLSFYCFSIGSLTIGIWKNTKHVGDQLIKDKKCNYYTIFIRNNRKILQLIIVFLGIIGFLGLLYSLVYSIRYFGGYSKLFTYNNALYRRIALTSVQGDFSLGKIFGYSLIFTFSGAAISGFYIAAISPSFLFSYLSILNVVLYEIIFMGRADIVIVFIMYIVSYFCGLQFIDTSYLHKKLSIFKKNRWFLTVTFSIAIIIFIIISNILKKGLGEFTNYTSIHYMPKIFLHVYSYITNSFPALSIVLSRGIEKSLSLGQATFYPIAIVLRKAGLLPSLLDTSYVLGAVRTPIPTNTFTYLRPIHEDFGILGIIIIPYIIGMVSSYIYVKFRERPTLIRLVILSYIYPFIIFSIQGNLFWGYQYTFSFFLTFIIVIILEKGYFPLGYIIKESENYKKV